MTRNRLLNPVNLTTPRSPHANTCSSGKQARNLFKFAFATERPNVPRQPVRAEHLPKLEELASPTRLHAFVKRRPVQLVLCSQSFFSISSSILNA